MISAYIYLSMAVAAGALFFYIFTDLKKDALHWGLLLWLVLTVTCIFRYLPATGILVLLISAGYKRKSNLERVILYLLLLCIIPSGVS